MNFKVFKYNNGNKDYRWHFLVIFDDNGKPTKIYFTDPGSGKWQLTYGWIEKFPYDYKEIKLTEEERENIFIEFL